MKRLVRSLSLVASLAIILVPSLSRAQDSEPDTLISVRIITVKPEMVSQYVKLLREMKEARVEAGSPTRHVWQEVQGTINTFHIVSEYENYEALGKRSTPPMEDFERANYFSQMRTYIQSVELLTLRSYGNLKIPNDEGVQAPLLKLQYVTLPRGQHNEFRAWLSDSFLPALRKVGVKGRSYYRILEGGNTNTMVVARDLNAWADLDAPRPLSTLSQEEREVILKDWQSIELIEQESKILRYRNDLSNEAPE